MVQGLKVLKKANPRRTGAKRSGFLCVAFPIAAPDSPIGQGGLEHGFRGFVEPAVFATGKIAFDGGNGLFASRGEYSRFPSPCNRGVFPRHDRSGRVLISMWQQSGARRRTIQCSAKCTWGSRMRTAHSTSLRERISVVSRWLRPDPRGRSELLGFARDVRAMPGGQSDDAGMARDCRGRRCGISVRNLHRGREAWTGGVS